MQIGAPLRAQWRPWREVAFAAPAALLWVALVK